MSARLPAGQPEYRAGSGVRFLVTSPEGVPLHFEIASAGARAGGVLLDYAVVALTLFLLWAAVVLTGLVAASPLTAVFALIFSFLMLHFYFTFFEVRWQGATPGKRVAGTRVISRQGGPVRGDAVATRNFLRIVEVFVPLEMLQLWSSDSLSGVPWYLILLGAAWAFLLAFLPLFNRHHLRLGDLAAGTVVVRAPRPLLLDDLGETGARRPRSTRYTFRSEQLEVYGEYELQTLEDLLRAAHVPDRETTLRLVAEKIATRIGWERTVSRRETRAFLQAYYEALRAHRERRMLFGRRKRDKHSDEG